MLEGPGLGSWANKFEHPTKKDLLAGLGKEHAALFEKAYRAVAAATDSKPKVTWLGLPWMWSFEYACPSHGLLEQIYLIPNPESPLIAATIRSAFFEKNSPDSFPKLLRPGIGAGVLVNHQTWCSWELADKEVLSDFLDLISLALKG